MADYTLSTMNLCGASFPVKRGGAGPVMVMLHGSGGAPRFLPGMQALARKFEVIVPQVPGFGGTEPPPWLETIADIANFYLEFLAALDLSHVHLVGLSLGGWTAAELAVRNASRVASLTLMDSPGIEVPGLSPLDTSRMDERDAVRAVYYDAKFADDAITRTFRPENEKVRLANLRIVERIARQRGYHDPQLQRWLHRIRIPSLIVWGEGDRLFPPAYGEAWQKAIAGSQLVVLPRCGHLPIQEKPEEFAALVGDFCARVQ